MRMSDWSSDVCSSDLLMIAGERLDQSASEGLGFLLGYRRDHGHASARSPSADNPVPEEHEPVVDVGDMGLVHIQRQLQVAFQKGPAFLADGLGKIGRASCRESVCKYV